MGSSTQTKRSRAQRAGALAAAREHERLRLSLEEPVDIYGVIREAGLWLMFQPLDRLYGAYYRAGDVPGIIVNARHPQSLQRFTAAHEYGHFLLRHEPSLDRASQIGGQGAIQDPREMEAQAFAASFLMPPRLVNRVLNRLHLHGDDLRDISPRQAYLVALELGASYSATVNHLAALEKISIGKARVLAREAPRAIKEDVGFGRRPEHAWADAWPLELPDSGKTFYPRVRDEVHLYLPESPTTGYVWMLDQGSVAGPSGPERGRPTAVDPSLSLVADAFDSDGPEHFGSQGTRHLVFQVTRPGAHELALSQRRPWEVNRTSLGTFSATLHVEPMPTGSAERGLSEAQRPLVATL